ncbi:MAG: L,D-transpeptidase family protein [Methyloligellaceae bacterium]
MGPCQGILRLESDIWRCALGAGGIVSRKREGDGAAPMGRWRLREVLYRPDRLARPRTALPVRAMRAYDGWCDAPADRNYNRPVRLPYGASAEALWREDHLYDVVVGLGVNDRPRVRGRGSAIFIHLARPGYAPTEGCVALQRRDLLRILGHCDRRSIVEILT